jgi:hypothetical protein
MFPAASIASDFGTAVGVLAGAIAVGGFLSHARPALECAGERKIQQATVTGGLISAGVGAAVAVLSAFVGILGP